MIDAPESYAPCGNYQYDPAKQYCSNVITGVASTCFPPYKEQKCALPKYISKIEEENRKLTNENHELILTLNAKDELIRNLTNNIPDPGSCPFNKIYFGVMIATMVVIIISCFILFNIAKKRWLNKQKKNQKENDTDGNSEENLHLIPDSIKIHQDAPTTHSVPAVPTSAQTPPSASAPPAETQPEDGEGRAREASDSDGMQLNSDVGNPDIAADTPPDLTAAGRTLAPDADRGERSELYTSNANGVPHMSPIP